MCKTELPLFSNLEMSGNSAKVGEKWREKAQSQGKVKEFVYTQIPSPCPTVIVREI